MERDEISVEGVAALKKRLRETWCGHYGMDERHAVNPDGLDAIALIEAQELAYLALSERVAKIGGDYSRFSKKLADDGLWDLLNEGSEREREAAEWIKALHDEVAALTKGQVDEE